MAGRHIERKGSIFSRFTRKQWIGAAAAAIAVVLIATGGAIAAWRNSGSRASRITEYSVSDLKAPYGRWKRIYYSEVCPAGREYHSDK